MNPGDCRRRFRAILAGDACIYPASVYDAISARIAGDLGFEAMMLAGSVASMVVLGAPDIAVLTLTELAEQARRICRAGTLPLLVDADHGYGNALNVMRTVSELGSAGVAALTIEDTLLPRAFGAANDPQLIPLEEGVGKMRAAIAARSDNDIVIVARTSAAAAGLEEAVARVKAYAVTGVDAVFLSGIRSANDIDAIAAATTLPIILGNIPGPSPGRDHLAARGVRVCLQGNQTFLAAVRGAYAALKTLKEGAAADSLDVADPQTVRRLTCATEYAAWCHQFLGAKT